MAPPFPPIPPDPPARDRDGEPGADGLLVRGPGTTDHLPGPGIGILADGVAGAEPAPTGTFEGEGRLPLSEVPFAWQQGRRLLLLDEEHRGWTFAELRFDNGDCRYVEIRRATFRWPREAAGALLARGVAFGSASMERLAGALDRWIAVHRSADRPDDAERS